MSIKTALRLAMILLALIVGCQPVGPIEGQPPEPGATPQPAQAAPVIDLASVSGQCKARLIATIRAGGLIVPVSAELDTRATDSGGTAGTVELRALGQRALCKMDPTRDPALSCESGMIPLDAE